MTTQHIVPWVSGGQRVRPVLRPWGGGSLDRILADLWSTRLPVPGAQSAVDYVPRIDVDETDEAIEVRAELPGLDEKDFEVLVDADVLEIKGEREESREDLVHHETSRGSFGRKLRLSFEPDPDAVKASYSKGVLTVTIPKPEEEQPKVRTIPVTAS